jgi:small nuclear ribonucleoprotein G
VLTSLRRQSKVSPPELKKASLTSKHTPVTNRQQDPDEPGTGATGTFNCEDGTRALQVERRSDCWSRAMGSTCVERGLMLTSLSPRHVQYMDKLLMINVQGSRKVSGYLRGYDIFLNLVLDDAREEGSADKIPCGTVVCPLSFSLSVETRELILPLRSTGYPRQFSHVNRGDSKSMSFVTLDGRRPSVCYSTRPLYKIRPSKADQTE